MTATLTGRALDVAVAIALGWRRRGADDMTSPGHGKDGRGINWDASGPHDYLVNLADTSDDRYYLCPCEFTHRHREDYLPFYSTDIAAAWSLVEWLRERWGGSFNLECYSNSRWLCVSVDGFNRLHIPYIKAEGATAPEAIARAVLAALDQD